MQRLGPLTLGCILVTLLSVNRVVAQDAKSVTFTDEQLEQIAAPVALYPDSLLMQVFMSATYPLEVVEADRWLKKQAGLSGSALEEALKGEDWDPSVKSLCVFPTVLSRMSENLDWTSDMGDAFLGQQAALLDAVQRLRGKAYEAGNLKTTKEQTVTVTEEKIIVIEPPSPEVVYVPTYYPTVVYGTWPYPTTYYAPLYVAPPPGYTAAVFGAGIVVGAALYGGCHWGWGHSEVDIDVDHHYEFERNTSNNVQRRENAQGKREQWKHDAEHRRGVNYRNTQVAQKYAGAGNRPRPSTAEARGFGQSDRGAGARPQPAAQPASRSTPSRTSSSASSSGGAFGGSQNAGFDRAASNRGAASRGRSSFGGGGGRRGGGRR